MTIQEIMERERWEMEEFFVKGNFNIYDDSKVYDENTVFHIPPFPDIKGVDAFKQVSMSACQFITDIQWNWVEVIIEGNTAVQRFTCRGKHTGKCQRIKLPPTGKEVFLEGCSFHHVKNGKIVEFIEYSNYMGLFQQLGVIPPMG